MSDTDLNYIQASRLRLNWAARCIENLADDFDLFKAGFPYFVVVNQKIEQKSGFVRQDYIFQSKAVSPLLLRFKAGDVIHNLRAVVDNLLWGAGQKFGAHVSLSFQFTPTRAEFMKYRRRTKLKRLPKPIRHWVMREQSCFRPAEEPTLLRMINHLWSGDKHRSPMLIGGVVSDFHARFKGIRHGGFEYGPTLGLKDGDKIANILIHPDDIIKFQPNFTMDVAFDQDKCPTHSSATLFLRHVHKHILEEIFPIFEPFS
ncbi:MAG: hypothetical protein IH984_16235 [Planctomycetes bacterium]|nr:hypothetical protein [Planctomycetota bacterium]